jgi:GT2 family glycosyltransferase
MNRDANDRALVYVILLNWNGWKDTLACIDSLKRLTYPEYRILVVDNGSTNDSVHRIRTAFPDVPILEAGSNLGFAGGCNLGIRHALAQNAVFIWLLNNDTVVEPYSLQAMVEVAESDERIGAVGSVLYWMAEPSRVQAWGGGWVSFWTGRWGHHYLPAPLGKLHYLTGASLLVRREALEDVGLLDEQTFFMYWEDTDLCFRFRKRGWKLAVAERSVIFHKQAASTGKDSPLLAFYGAKSSFRFFLRHSPFPVWTITIGTSGRIFKRMLRLQSGQMKAVIKGMWEALKEGA